jgi:hypothetical protein
MDTLLSESNTGQVTFSDLLLQTISGDWVLGLPRVRGDETANT